MAGRIWFRKISSDLKIVPERYFYIYLWKSKFVIIENIKQKCEDEHFVYSTLSYRS